MLTLSVEQRDTKVKPETLRGNGKVPAVFYGPKEESTSVSLNEREFNKIWRQAGESTIVQLKGVGEEMEALIHEVAVHPLSGDPLHVDFYVFEKGKKMEVAVPLEFVGEAPAVKGLGGTLVKAIYEITVSVLPKDLPSEVTVDISSLETFESNITVKDLAFPEGVEVLAEPDEAVASVMEPKEEPEPEETDGEIDMDAIEVEGEKKDGEEAPAEAERGEEKPAE